MRIHAAVVALFILAIAPAFAASLDADFLKDAAKGGQTQIQVAKLAKERATHQDARNFADHMLMDHSKMSDEMAQLAQKLNIQLPAAGPDDKFINDKFGNKNGMDFDRAFAAWAVEDHQKDLEKFNDQAKNGKDADIRAFAEKNAPMIQDHLKMARDLNDKLSKGAALDQNPAPVEQPINTAVEQRSSTVEQTTSTIEQQQPLPQPQPQVAAPEFREQTPVQTAADQRERYVAPQPVVQQPVVEEPVNVSYQPATVETSVDCGCEVKHHCSSCNDCGKFETIVYDNDYRATETDLIEPSCGE